MRGSSLLINAKIWSLVPWLVLLLLGLIWGLSFVGVKASLDAFSPLQVASLRILIGASCVICFSYAFGMGLPKFARNYFRIWVFAFGMALFSNVLPFSLLSWAQKHVDSSFAGVTMTIVPLFVLPLAHYFVASDQMSVRKLFGFLVGFIGAVMLFGINETISSLATPSDLLPKFACLLAAICYAIGSIITRLSPSVPQLALSSAALLLASVIIIPITYSIDGIPTNITNLSLLGIIFLGLFPTGIATVLLVYLIKRSGPSFLSLVNYQVPVWALVFGALLYGEMLPKELLLALLLILLGLVISSSSKKHQ